MFPSVRLPYSAFFHFSIFQCFNPLQGRFSIFQCFNVSTLYKSVFPFFNVSIFQSSLLLFGDDAERTVDVVEHDDPCTLWHADVAAAVGTLTAGIHLAVC